MTTNVQTGTNLSQFDQSLVDLQAQLDTPPSYIAPMDPNSRLARGLNTVVNIGLGRQSFGDIAKDYATRKLDELPQFSQKYEFNEGEQNFSDYAEGLLFYALPTKAKAAAIYGPDIKNFPDIFRLLKNLNISKEIRSPKQLASLISFNKKTLGSVKLKKIGRLIQEKTLKELKPFINNEP